jgi:hypothetical protein
MKINAQHAIAFTVFGNAKYGYNHCRFGVPDALAGHCLEIEAQIEASRIKSGSREN